MRKRLVRLPAKERVRRASPQDFQAARQVLADDAHVLVFYVCIRTKKLKPHSGAPLFTQAGAPTGLSATGAYGRASADDREKDSTLVLIHTLTVRCSRPENAGLQKGAARRHGDLGRYFQGLSGHGPMRRQSMIAYQFTAP